MRKLFFEFISLTVLSGLIFPQQQNWKWKNPLPQGNPLFYVNLFNAQNITVVGDAGTIMNSNNGGLNWQISNTGTTGNFRNAFYFQNGLVGYAIGLNSSLFKTTDAGYSWFQINFIPDYHLFAIDFINENIGFIGGYGLNEGSRVFKTTDGGNTWEQSDSLALYRVQSIKFLDNQNGIAAGWIGVDSVYYKTSNGGQTWSKKNIQFQSQWDYIKSFCFINNNLGFAAGTRCIIKTTDAGETWDYLYSGTDALNAICFPGNETTGFIVGDFNIVKKTTDGGITWQQLNTNVTGNFFFNNVKFINNLLGIIVGTNGIILKTTDGGTTWEHLSSNVSLAWHTSLDFPLNSQVGYVCGLGSIYRILKTTNGGSTWVPQTISSSVGLRKINFINNDTGYVVGDNAAIFKTVNGGASWEYQINSLSNYLFEVEFPSNSEVGYVAGLGGTFAKTTDGGLSWNPLGSFNKDIYAVSFPLDDQVGYVATSYERIYKTTDGGLTWGIKYDGNAPQRYIMDILFPFNDQVGYALLSGSGTINSKVIKTTDGGTNWSQIDLGVNKDVLSLSFPSQNVGYISGSNDNNSKSTFFKTTDAGETWNLLKVPYTYDITSVCFPENVDTGYIVGNHSGAILKTTNGGGVITSVFDITVQQELSNFTLCQNYPNPFNPGTTISWQSPVSSWQTIKMFNSLGQEVETIVDGYYEAGIHSKLYIVNSSLPSGVYYYQLKAGSFIETKKMILIK